MVCDGPIRLGPNKGKPVRGTEAGNSRHRRAAEEPCQACRDGAANAQRRRRDRKKGSKAGRRLGEWCRSLEHRMTPENTLTRANGNRRCRACKLTYQRRQQRKTVECTGCDRWLTIEGFDVHQVSPLGNPNAALVCLDDDELIRRNLEAVSPPTPTDVDMWWRIKPLTTHCRNGHKRTKDNTGIDYVGRRVCRICKNAAARRYRARNPAEVKAIKARYRARLRANR